MPPGPRRAPIAARVGLARAAAAGLLAALGCADADLPAPLCRLFASCASDAAMEVAPPPPIDYEPEPVVAPRVAGGRLLLHSVGFAPGSADHDAEAEIVLDVAAGEILQRTGIRVRVEGHADAGGSGEADASLALRRAEAVRRYLVRKGVAPQRLETLARDSASPVASSATEQEKTRNRRVELVVL